MVPIVAPLGIASFSLVFVLIFQTCIHHEKLDFYGWSYIAVSIILLIVITLVNPMGSKPMKTMILGFIPINSLSVSSMFFEYKKLISSHRSGIQQGDISKEQISFFKDHAMSYPTTCMKNTIVLNINSS